MIYFAMTRPLWGILGHDFNLYIQVKVETMNNLIVESMFYLCLKQFHNIINLFLG